MKSTTTLGLIVSLLAASGTAQAATYNVNRSFLGVSLTGTVEVPLGNHVIEDQGVHPFTNVDLTLTAGGGAYDLEYAVTELVIGDAQFIIDATPTTLTFDTANTDGGHDAMLFFSDTGDIDGHLYFIGTGQLGGTESAFNERVPVSLPVVFGTIIPEPSAAALAALGLLVAAGWWRFSRS